MSHTMNQVSLTEDFSLSRIVYGVWRWNENEQSLADAEALLETCLENGIDSFDHADIYNNYSNEAFFGQLLARQPGLRQKMKIITKCGIQLMSDKRPETYVKHYNYSREHIVKSVDNSLKNLHTEYLDLLLLHRPSPLLDADQVPETLTSLKESGKVRYVGVSNFTPSQFSLLQSRLSLPLVTNQIELSLIHHQPLTDGTVDFLYERRIKPMIWSPLGGGKIFTDDNKGLQAVLASLSDKYACSADILSLSWLLRHPAEFIPVVGTNQGKRIMAAAKATEVSLDLQDWFLIYETAMGRSVP